MTGAAAVPESSAVKRSGSSNRYNPWRMTTRKGRVRLGSACFNWRRSVCGGGRWPTARRAVPGWGPRGDRTRRRCPPGDT